MTRELVRAKVTRVPICCFSQPSVHASANPKRVHSSKIQAPLQSNFVWIHHVDGAVASLH